MLSSTPGSPLPLSTWLSKSSSFYSPCQWCGSCNFRSAESLACRVYSPLVFCELYISHLFILIILIWPSAPSTSGSASQALSVSISYKISATPTSQKIFNIPISGLSSNRPLPSALAAYPWRDRSSQSTCPSCIDQNHRRPRNINSYVIELENLLHALEVWLMKGVLRAYASGKGDNLWKAKGHASTKRELRCWSSGAISSGYFVLCEFFLVWFGCQLRKVIDREFFSYI